MEDMSSVDNFYEHIESFSYFVMKQQLNEKYY
jgi:hypothetical protein